MKNNMFAVYLSITLAVVGVWFFSLWFQEGISDLLVTGFATSDYSDTTATITVNEFISLTLVDGFPIAFGSLNPATTNSSATTNPSNITIGSETNVLYNITINATSNFNSTENYQIGISNMTWVSNEFTQTALVLNTEDLLYENEGCPCGTAVTNNSIWFYIDVPAGRFAATYEANITIGAEG